MKIKATFEIEDSFYLTKRGIVLYGNIIDGKVCIEDFILFNISTTEIKLRIKDINFLDKQHERYSKIGLTFYYENAEQEILFEQIKVSRQIAKIVTE